MALSRVFRSLVSRAVGLAPASNFSSSLRFSSSACVQERVFADLLYCRPPWNHRRDFRQSQRLHDSSPAYLQDPECLTKIVIDGIR